ncbi:hypothetical protein NEOLEDRAFT_1139464 [Neolentinus lepideus HHB14362 ss-1]|uniref:Uncharacterized protein n=1 Tax=Neolentinus lepideus HHB14362 ss-1 TaxID=1314782 RepID=A0A165PQN6_9AGAM|nr:hypothetical protein NEOLEDRAFT_1139464 [Neolentinus lepideus HHB14362 ss-1]
MTAWYTVSSRLCCGQLTKDYSSDQIFHAIIVTKLKDTEVEAARQRNVLRKFREEQMVEMVQEEGRRKGYTEGLRRGWDI